MKGRFDYFKYQRYNDKRKKPWRNLKPDVPSRKNRKIYFRKKLLLLVVLEAAVIFLSYEETIAGAVHGVSFFNQEAKVETEVTAEAFWGRKTGETKEQGLSVDWKEGTVKLWQKVERVILQGPD